MNHPTESKYRPVLSSSHISHILSLCRNDMSAESLRVIGVLAQFEHKIKNQAVSPAYKVDVPQSLSVNLGFEAPKEMTGIIPPERLYEMWKGNPAQLSVSELESVRAYRYMNDLMTPEESKKYEIEVIGPALDNGK